MGHTVDLVGKKFGRLSVLAKTDMRDICGNVLWKCRCECGSIIDVRTANLKNGHCQSCGCLNKEINRRKTFKDLTGTRIGFLVVLGFAGNNKYGKSTWWCKCDCGRIKITSSSSLMSGITVSCGCYHRKRVSENRGEKNYRWKGGYSVGDYSREWTKYLKEFIRNRDNRRCQYPNCDYDDTKEKQKLSVHHIDGNKRNCAEYNLISLCNSHHQIVENNEPRSWENWFYVYTESFEI